MSLQTPDSHLLRIRHRTHYSYHFPVTFEPHRLVIRPREGHDLRVEELTMTIEPQATLVWTRDLFGNSIAHAHFQEQASELVIESDVTLRRFFNPNEPPHLATSASPYPLQYDPLEQGIITGYLSPVFPEESASVQRWIGSQPPPGDFPSAEAYVIAMTRIIQQSIGYQRREQKGVQSPDTTLSLGTGSCRDVATLLMEALRHLGIAARFASGYLDCPNTRAARGSTHAWTEVYFPRLGWNGFDPTIGEPCDHRHIVTGTSHHPRGVMPVSGRIFGPGNSFRSLTVGVEFSSPPFGLQQSQFQS
ncbi:transglutaminase N-terminal domain-containing protein [Haloferula chungangensis]|uniref:Transglutaminase N-terminal domain-containing protein n=1 Tax=Haloferula chungangensis TaxID=1048331 RepID=A0ABW2L518_9BACT